MARPAEGIVRELSPSEAERLVKITRTTTDRVRLRRAGIVVASLQGRSATDAATMFAMTAQYAREGDMDVLPQVDSAALGSSRTRCARVEPGDHLLQILAVG